MKLDWVGVRLSAAILCTLFGLASLGCYQRTVAPGLNYDETQVDSLGREIEKFDWE